MNREELLYLISVCGDQNAAAEDRWKSITFVSIINSGNIPAFKQKVASDEVRFVDKAITIDGVAGQITGFYILEHLSTENDFLGKAKHMTWVPCALISSISFNNLGTNDKQIYNTITEFITAITPVAHLSRPAETTDAVVTDAVDGADAVEETAPIS